MRELEILQQQFAEMAKKYPGVMHVLSIWPKGQKEPKLRKTYTPNKDNLIGLWGNGAFGEYLSGKDMKHWLIKPSNRSWDINKVRGNFQYLAEKAGRILIEKDFLSKLDLTEYLSKLSKYKLDHNNRINLWVLFVHSFGNTRKCINNPNDIKKDMARLLPTAIYESESIKEELQKPIQSFFEVQIDFFYESSSVISWLLEIKDIPKNLFSEQQLKVWSLLKNRCLSAKEMCKPLGLYEENIRQHIRAIRKKFGNTIIFNEPSRGYWRPDAPPPDYKEFLSWREACVSSQQEHGNN